MKAEDPDEDDFCPFCRIHPIEGMRKHKFSKKHRKKLKDKLVPFLKKVRVPDLLLRDGTPFS